MKKITKKSHLILYACSGIGVNMLNLIVGSYLCSALIIGGFDAGDIGLWTYTDKTLVVVGLWSILSFFAKAADGLIDLPFSAFADNLRTKWGKRRPGIVIGLVPTVVFYLLFLVPLNSGATVLNTLWFVLLLFLFYGSYTLTMLTYYATFAEVVEDKEDVVLLSNTKSVCDVIYFILGYALLPVFVNMGTNIRIVALIFLPLALSMLIPLFMLKEKDLTKGEEGYVKKEKVSMIKSLSFTLKCKEFVHWMCVLAVMNVGLQLFLGGINEFFSTLNLNQTVVMACCFAPVPLTILLYNKVIRTKGLGFAYRYIIAVFAFGMALMYVCNHVPNSFVLPLAIVCSLTVSLSIGSFFSVTYTVPSHIAATKNEETGKTTSTMFFAVQGLFEAISAAFGTQVILVLLKDTIPDGVRYMTLLVSLFSLLAFAFSFTLPKSITQIGIKKQSK